MTPLGQALWTRLDAAARPLTDDDLRALSPLLVIAPHADDETLGCGCLLARASALGLRPRVVFLTDGSASHVDSPTWPPSRLAEARRQEALAALSVLGLTAEQAFFMDWPDAAPLDPGSEAYGRSLARLLGWIENLDLRSLWAPRAGEPHCDHEAATALAEDLARRRPGVRRLQYLVWAWEDAAIACAGPGEQAWRLLCVGTSALRRRALDCHRTQTTGLIADAGQAFLIPEALAAVVDRPSEIFIEQL